VSLKVPHQLTEILTQSAGLILKLELSMAAAGLTILGTVMMGVKAEILTTMKPVTEEAQPPLQLGLAELLDQVLLTATQQVIGDTRGAVMEVPVVQEVVIQREEMES
jgi:hypothetical protein